MDIYRISGNKPLKGEVIISGAKNAALPIIVASLLADGETILHNVPDLKDIRTIIKVIEHLGPTTSFDPDTNTLSINVQSITSTDAPYDLVKTMRASIYVMGPLLARTGKASVSLPGGCAIGERPVDIHLKGYEAMGAEIELEAGNIIATTPRLKGTTYIMPKVSVGATAHLLMGAVLAEGTTILENCAMEPDVVDLGEFLTKMGANISGLGTDRITIEGVERLHPVEHSIMPDRIEAGTYLLAAAATRSPLTVTKVVPSHFAALNDSLREIGFDVQETETTVSIAPTANLQGAIVRTLPFPGFPTDLQAPMMALMTTLPGISVMIETIFENRYTHVPELRRMGADIAIEGNVAIIKGKATLSAAPVMMSDLRAGAALIVAGLAAHGSTEIRRIYHSDRGYEKLCHKLSLIGADIEREKGGDM